MIEIIETKNVYSDGSVRATVMSDTSAELTGITSVDGTKLRFGLLALVAKEDVVCKLASNGVWYKSGISLEDVTVTPSTSQQTVTAGEGYDGIGTVTVEAVSLEDKTVTPSISRQTITAGVNYNGIGTVTVEAATLRDRDVTPSTSPQMVLPGPDDYGLRSVAVKPVTFTIDSNIVAENIKKNVTILGVTGTYDGSGGPTYTEDFIGFLDGSAETINIPIGTTSIRNMTFVGLENLIQVNIPSSVQEIGERAFMSCIELETITINKGEDSISGAPWGATNAEIVWTG